MRSDCYTTAAKRKEKRKDEATNEALEGLEPKIEGLSDKNGTVVSYLIGHKIKAHSNVSLLQAVTL
jgi:hypothetical protein